MDEIKHKLKLAECPFNWNLSDVMDSRKSAAFIIEELLQKEEEEMSEHWLHVCLYLTIAYLHYENEDTRKATEVLIKFENKLNSSTEDLIAKYKPALESVYNASRACLLLTTMSTPSEIKQFSDKVPRIEDLDRPNHSAMYAIKAYVFSEFGVKGSKMALEYAEEALIRNNTEAYWHFLMGKLLSRARNFTQNHEITSRELLHLRKAFSLNKTPHFAVFLANTLVKKSKSVFLKASNNGMARDKCVVTEIRRLTAEAKESTEFALVTSQKKCPRILTRCAYVYSKLPYSDRKLDTAKELIELSLKLNPNNPMASKMAGDICLLLDEPKYHEALEHYTNAASRNVCSANLEAFNIKVQLNMDLDAKSFHVKMLEHYKETNYQMLIFVHATAYYLLIAKDLCEAVKYFMKAIELDPSYHQLTNYWTKYLKKQANLYELINNEVRHAIDSGKFSTTQLDLLKNTCEKIFEIKPELKDVDVDPNKLENYPATTQEKKRANPSERGRGFKWRRGFRGRN